MTSVKKVPKRYDLTIYVTIDGCGFPLVSKCFRSIDKLIRYCADWDDDYIDRFNILFDVYDNVRGQYNVNDIVEAFKYA